MCGGVLSFLMRPHQLYDQPPRMYSREHPPDTAAEKWAAVLRGLAKGQLQNWGEGQYWGGRCEPLQLYRFSTSNDVLYIVSSECTCRADVHIV